MSPSTSTTTFFTLGLLVLLIIGVQASPLQQQQSSSDETNNGAGAAVDSIVLSRGSVGQAAAASNPFLEKALQRASFRLSQLPSSSSNGNSDSGDFFSSLRDRVYLIRPFARNPFTRNSPSSYSSSVQKRMQCISGLPGGDCENSFLGGESLGQDFLRPGGRNPGRR